MRTAALLLLSAALGCEAEPASSASSAAITHGTGDQAHTAVVALIGQAGPYCSGTLIADRFVVTAGHCVGAALPQVAFDAVPSAASAAIPVLDARVHPGFDAATLAHDVALLLLSEPAPASAERAQLAAAGADGPAVGTTVLVVGFGRTEAPVSPSERRVGSARVAGIDGGWLELEPEPSQPCNGDSGGAVLAGEPESGRLVGVISHGDTACAAWARGLWLDQAALQFIDAAREEMTRRDQPTGARCVEDAECASALCLFPEDAPAIGYCTEPCVSQDDCPSSLQCELERCRHPLPSPGALGAGCAVASDCDSRQCARAEDGVTACSASCLPGASASCPEAFACEARADRPGFACFPERSAGCAVSPGGRPVGLFPLLLYLVAMVIAGARGPSTRRRKGA